MTPVIGPEGSRACLEMIEAARLLFGRYGYHGTSTTAIAAATGRSDTAFYQYFAGKHALVRHLFEQFGQDLLDHFERLPYLEGPGSADLRDWVTGLSVVMRAHHPVFVYRPEPDADESATANPEEEYIARIIESLTPRLGDADTEGVDVRTLSVSIMSIAAHANAVHDVRCSLRGVPPDPEAVDATVSDVVARALFPHLAEARIVPGTCGNSGPVRTGREDELEDDRGLPGLRRPLTRRTQRTVGRVLAGAVEAFGRKGLHGTTVTDIVAAAGVAHGTFYTYWGDRAAIFRTLTHLAVAAVRRSLDLLDSVPDTVALERWLDGWLDVIDEHGPILHLLPSATRIQPELAPSAAAGEKRLECAARRLGVSPKGPVATSVLWTILAELSYSAWRHRPVLARDAVRRAQTLFLVRGLLGRDMSSPWGSGVVVS